MSKHIFIVGAGAAGLMAAAVLLEKGYEITMVEARDRVGGRIHSITSGFSIPVETGAEFVHGDQPATLALIKEAGASLSNIRGNFFHLANGELRAGYFFDDQWEKMVDVLKELKVDSTMASFMDLHFPGDKYPELYKSVKGFVEGYDAADMHKVSAMALKDEWSEADDEHQYHIKGGYQCLVDYLKQKIDRAGGTIVLSTPVSEIQLLDSGVGVITSSGQRYEGAKVIVTVPMGVLQKGDIKFTPPAPSYQAAFNNVGFGGVIKIIIEFKTAFWRDDGRRSLSDLAFVFSDAEIPTWWSQLPLSETILTGWLGGPATTRVPHSRELLYEKAIESLSYIFNTPAGRIETHIRHWHIENWVQDPYSYGAYAYATVETNLARKILSAPIADRIYFAGEAIYAGPAMGTVEAALVSGKNVAERITSS